MEFRSEGCIEAVCRGVMGLDCLGFIREEMKDVPVGQNQKTAEVC